MSYPIFYSENPVRDAERYQAWLDRNEGREEEEDK